jgi:hypothetical protein
MTGFNGKREAALDKLVQVTEELGLYDKPAQEPVAWGYRNHDGAIYDCISPEAHADAEGDYTVPLYTTPQQRPWVGLTDEEITKLDMDTSGTVHDFVDAVESALRSKNNGT